MGGNNLADVQRLSIVADPANANGSAFGGIRAGNAVFGGSSGVVGISAANVAVQDVVRIGDVQATGSASPALFFGANSQFGVVTVTGGDLVNSKTINNAGYRYDLELTSGGDSNSVTLPAQNTYAQLNFTQNPPSVAAAIAAATPPASKSLNLTTGVDTTLVGGAADDVFSGSIGTDGLASNGTSLNVSDNLPGGAGTDKLSLTISGTNTAAVTTTGFTLTGVEVLEVSNFETSAFDNTINASQVTGLTNVNLASSSATGATAVTNLRNLVGAGMANGSANLTLSYTDAAVAGASDVQNVTLSGQTGGTLTAGAATGAIETVSIVSSGSANTLTLAVPGAQTINVSGDQNLALTESITNTVNRVDASTLTGNLTYTTDDLLAQSITGGSGNDSFVFGANFAAADSIDGGAGTNDNLTVGASITSADLANVTNVERLTLGAGANATLAANVSPTTFDLRAAGANTLTLNTGYSAATTVHVGAGDTVAAGNATGALTVHATESGMVGTAITANNAATSPVLTDALHLTTSSLTATNIALATQLSGIDRITVIDGGDSATTGLSNSAGFDVSFTTGAISYSVTVDASALDASIVAGAPTDGTAETLNFDGSSAASTSVLNVTGGAARDTIIGGAGNDILNGGAGDDSLVGGAGVDNISAGDGDDTINMANRLTSADTIDGGAGTDKLLVTDLPAGALTNVSNVETLVIGGAPATLSISAPVSFSTIDMDNGDEATAQTLTLATGFTSSSTFLVDGGDSITNSANAAITVRALDSSMATVTVTGGTGVDTLNIVPTAEGAVNVSLAGRVAGVEVINVLDGGDSSTTAGRDASITTGDYASTALVATTLTVDATALDAGATTGANENLTLNASGITNALVRVSVTGGSGNDVLTGGAGNDVLAGGAGADNINGGSGNNTLIGDAGNDTLTGGTGVDSISGGDGDDRIVMGANLSGVDTIDGGAGSNTLSVSGALTDATIVNVSSIQVVEADNTVTFGAQATRAGISTISQSAVAAVNVAEMTGNLTINAYGAGNQNITGGSGNDTINFGGTAFTDQTGAGSGGTAGDALDASDVIAGGLGNDTIVVSNVRGSITPTLNLNTGGVTGIETIRLGSTAGRATATATAQTITLTVNDITSAAERTVAIDASVINDSNDTVTVQGQAGAGAAIVAGGTSFSITGGKGNDTLFGGNNADTIAGGDGADNITGGGGADVLTGGGGADNFFIVGSLGTARDTITDFTAGSDNLKVEISSNAATIDATLKGTVTNAGDSSAVMTSVIGQYVFNTANSTLLMDLDGNGIISGTDVQVTLQGATSLSSADVDFTITGTLGGNQAITTGAGNDTIVMAALLNSADAINAGAGSDTLTYTDDNTLATQLAGVTNVETITIGNTTTAIAETLANDTLVAQGATVTITATALTSGQAVINAANETDGNVSITIGTATSGTTTVTSAVTVTGGSGNDSLTINTNGQTEIVGGPGNDTITRIGTGAATINGGAGVDVITGGAGIDTIFYASSAELIADNAIVDNVNGGSGTDVLSIGTSGTAFTIGSAASFARVTNVESIVAVANTAAVSVSLAATAETAGIRTIDLSSGTSATGNVINVSTFSAAATTTLTGSSSGATAITGGLGVDNITGGSAVDNINGGGGNDVITGGGDADVLNGGEGDDTYLYATSAAFVTGTAVVDSISDSAGSADRAVVTGAISIASTQSLVRAGNVEQLVAATVPDDGAATGGLAHSIVVNTTATLGSFRTIDLSPSADANSTGVVTLTGVTVGVSVSGVAAGNNTLTGGSGVDTIVGGSISDTLVGGGGADVLTGGAGADTFQMFLGDEGDTITDFVSGTDQFDFDETALLSINASSGISFQSAAAGTALAAGTTVFELAGVTTNGTAADLISKLGATAINSAIDAGDKLLIVAYKTGGGAQIWMFTDANGENIEAGELVLVAELTGVAADALASGDFI